MVEENYAAKSEEKQIDDDYDASQAEWSAANTTRRAAQRAMSGRNETVRRRRRPARGGARAAS